MRDDLDDLIDLGLAAVGVIAVLCLVSWQRGDFEFDFPSIRLFGPGPDAVVVAVEFDRLGDMRAAFGGGRVSGRICRIDASKPRTYERRQRTCDDRIKLVYVDALDRLERRQMLDTQRLICEAIWSGSANRMLGNAWGYGNGPAQPDLGRFEWQGGI